LRSDERIVDKQYEAWNRALTEEYFPPGRAGRLAYLPVDDDELKATAVAYGLCEEGQAVNEFVAAARRELGHRGFARFAAQLAGWRRVRETPPYIGGLALCVFAASRMDTEASSGIASHNYYTQLNRLIGQSDHAGQPRGFDALPAVWEDLARWLADDCAGERGTSTIRTVSHHRFVGYPLSQCLLRAVDRRRLPDFFKAAGLAPDSEISAARVFSLLRAWAAQPACGLSAQARAAIAGAWDTDLAEIAETVERELRAWDGELRDARGRRRAPIHLLVIPRGRRPTVVTLIARRPEGFEPGRWDIDGSPGHAELAAHPASGWFQPLDLQLTSKILDSGIQLVRDDLALTLDPADAIPCRQADIEIGGYLSQPAAVMWEPHLAVVRRSAADALTGYLAGYVEGGSPRLQRQPSNLPGEWAIIHDFRFTRVPREPPVRFARFAPRLLSTTTFEGGLSIGPRELSPPIYLTGGEPDVNISADPDRSLAVTLDGEAQELTGGALQLALSSMGLEPGEHELVADVTRRFSTVTSFGEIDPVGAGSLGHRLSRHKDYLPDTIAAEPLPPAGPPRGVIKLTGALVSGSPADLPLGDRRPVLARAGKTRYAVIGAEGHEIAVPRQTTAPGWLVPLGLDHVFQFIEIHASFAPQWLLTESGDGTRAAQALTDHPVPPAPAGATASGWARVIGEWASATPGGEQADAWAAYVAAAGAAAA
jgi:hypothetical protein